MADYTEYIRIITNDDLEKLKTSKLHIDKASMIDDVVCLNAIKCLTWIIKNDNDIIHKTHVLELAISKGHYQALVMLIEAGYQIGKCDLFASYWYRNPLNNGTEDSKILSSVGITVDQSLIVHPYIQIMTQFIQKFGLIITSHNLQYIILQLFKSRFAEQELADLEYVVSRVPLPELTQDLWSRIILGLDPIRYKMFFSQYTLLSRYKQIELISKISFNLSNMYHHDKKEGDDMIIEQCVNRVKNWIMDNKVMLDYVPCKLHIHESMLLKWFLELNLSDQMIIFLLENELNIDSDSTNGHIIVDYIEKNYIFQRVDERTVFNLIGKALCVYEFKRPLVKRIMQGFTGRKLLWIDFQRQWCSIDIELIKHDPEIYNMFDHRPPMVDDLVVSWCWVGVSRGNEKGTYTKRPYTKHHTDLRFAGINNLFDLELKLEKIYKYIHSPTCCYFDIDHETGVFYHDQQDCVIWMYKDGKVCLLENDPELKIEYVAESLPEFLTHVADDYDQ